ncbi:putative deoxyribonuclease YjjV domain protein, partial [Vibrio parahaemolyticus V-223/04]
KQMGLTPDQKRSCVPYRKDPAHQNEEKCEALSFSDSPSAGVDKKSQDEVL